MAQPLFEVSFPFAGRMIGNPCRLHRFCTVLAVTLACIAPGPPSAIAEAAARAPLIPIEEFFAPGRTLRDFRVSPDGSRSRRANRLRLARRIETFLARRLGGRTAQSGGTGPGP